MHLIKVIHVNYFKQMIKYVCMYVRTLMALVIHTSY